MPERDGDATGELAPAQAGAPLRAIPVIELRGERVMLDAHIAEVLGVETRVFNQAFKRNQDRFPAGWAFELTAEEFDGLRSQAVMSSGERGGRRHLPWAFTEHGVVLAASLLNSDRAKAVMIVVVDTFVKARRGELGGSALTAARAGTVLAESGPFSRKAQALVERLMDTMVDVDNQRTLRTEAQAVLKETIDHLKARLGRPGLENEKIAAEAMKLLADAEATRASAARTRAETDEIALRTLAKKLTLALEAEQAMARGEVQGFLKVLRRLGKA